MSMKQNSNTASSFNPASMNAYNTMLPAASQGLTSNINNPQSNMLFNNQLGMGQQQIATGGQNQMNSFLNSQQSRGMGANSPMTAFGMQGAANSNAAQRSGLFGSLLNSASGFRQNSMQGALNFKPLQTGTNGQTYMTGTGTWLPQAASMGLAAGSSLYNSMHQNQFQNQFANPNQSGYANQINNTSMMNNPSFSDNPFTAGAAPDINQNYNGNYLPTFLQNYQP